MKKIILLIISLPICLSANFIGMNNGARALAMGNAFVALSDEATAIFSNPAGLARINQYYLRGSHQNLFGLSDLSNDMIAISFPIFFAQVATIPPFSYPRFPSWTIFPFPISNF